MISVSGKKWTERIINKNSIDKIKQNYGFSEILAKLIVSRKFNETEIFNIKNDIEINNKFISNKDYILASEILSNSIKNKEKICILGDYDVDGFSSTSLLVRFFKFIKHPYFYYIPDREKDGYGASKKLLVLGKLDNLLVIIFNSMSVLGPKVLKIKHPFGLRIFLILLKSIGRSFDHWIELELHTKSIEFSLIGKFSISPQI